ncbi:ras-related gtp-binding protein [Ochromonadaceae sp. CCMP2298]|nr:ras-related gtp-binding protein [Ochromonadaceae sp. CCMP2298]
MSEFVHQLKLLTIGDSGVGKTWLLMRWAGAADLIDKRSRSLPTIGVDFKMKTVSIDGRRVKIQVWDTAGQERFRTITNSYFRHSHGILLVFDVTDPRSFANIRSWIGQIELHDKEGLPTILVGNKCDLEDQRAVARDQAEAVAKEFGITYFETSAVENINVEDAFACIIEDVYVGMQERGQCLSEGRVLRGNNAQVRGGG